jgi:hypothetical protein
MSDYKLFMIPFDALPANPPYPVRYATWSTEPPELEPGMNSPMVVGATTEDTLPEGAVLLASGSKDPLPPPPPPPPGLSEPDYKDSLSVWMMAGRDV